MGGMGVRGEGWGGGPRVLSREGGGGRKRGRVPLCGPRPAPLLLWLCPGRPEAKQSVCEMSPGGRAEVRSAHFAHFRAFPVLGSRFWKCPPGCLGTRRHWTCVSSVHGECWPLSASQTTHCMSVACGLRVCPVVLFSLCPSGARGSPSTPSVSTRMARPFSSVPGGCD